jgi:hypothetical protein
MENLIVGIVSGGFLVYDILDMRRKNRKAQFKDKISQLDMGLGIYCLFVY